jgi:hypothetical protein
MTETETAICQDCGQPLRMSAITEWVHAGTNRKTCAERDLDAEALLAEYRREQADWTVS